LGSLTLQAGALNNFASGSTSTFGATKLTVSGLTNGVAPTATAGTGTLQFTGSEIDLGEGALNVAGFDSVQINASKGVVGTGNTQLAVVAGSPPPSGDPSQPPAVANLTITTPLVTTHSGLETQLSVPSGALVFAAPSGASEASDVAAQAGGAFVTDAR